MRSREGGRGQTLVEFAFVLPIFLLLVMATLDFGRVIYAQNAINNDAREGTRVGSVSAQQLSTTGSWTARYAAIRTAARAMSPGVELPDTAIMGKTVDACPVPLDPATTTCFYPTGANASGSVVYVQLTIQVPILTPIIGQVMGGSFTVSAVSEVLVQS